MNSDSDPYPIFTFIMNDGSRNFADIPQVMPWSVLVVHIMLLDGASVTNFITDNVTEGWLDFTYKGHNFSVNDQHGNYWFFVEDPECPDTILKEVVEHCRLLVKEYEK